MIHDNSDIETVSRLSELVRQLTYKVEKLESALNAISTAPRTKPYTRTSTIAILERMNNEVLPSMSMDAFVSYLGRMPCDAECVVDKNSAEHVQRG